MSKPVIKLPKPLPYQKDIIRWAKNPDVKFICLLKSRQTGGSFVNKMLVTMWALGEEKTKIGYICPTNKLCKLFFKELSASLEPFILNANKTDLRIDFISGSYIQFLSAESEDAIRGFQFHYVILDECAFMKDDTYNLIIRPTFLIKGRKVVFCSTPNGAKGFFHQACQLGYNNEKGYRVRKVTIYDNPFVSNEEIESIKKTVPQRVFMQEYLAHFLEGSGAVFRNISSCVIDKPELNGIYYAAIDWAKTTDYTVVTIINSLGQVVYTKRMNGLEYTQQVKIIVDILNQWKPQTTLSEENNIGTVVNEMLRKVYKGKLKCVNLDNSLKREIIEDLVVAFEQQKIGISNDEVVIRELEAFTVAYTPSSKTVSYSAPSGLHDDCVISLAYAYYLLKKGKTKYDIR
jgi:phage FluMu gp28-like protein